MKLLKEIKNQILIKTVLERFLVESAVLFGNLALEN